MTNTTTTTNAPVATLTETHEVIQVKGGKFHRPKQTTHARMEWLKPMPTECGYTVTALNVFNDIAHALEYTGGHREHLCAKCFPPATQTAHTPGPWVIDGDTIQGAPELNGEQPHAVEATCVAVVLSRERGSYRHYPKERATANARLIAAAPELLAALEKMLARWDALSVEDLGPGCRAIADNARAAIAKATGGAK